MSNPDFLGFLCLTASLAAPAVSNTALAQDIGTAYCPGVPNSTGAPSQASATGSRWLPDNDLTLHCNGLPGGQFGMFLFSLEAGFVAQPGGSVGNLCLGGSIGRDIAGVMGTGFTGSVTRDFDLTALPGASGPVAAMLGDQLHFQFWHRDSINPGSNFSSGVKVQLACEGVSFGTALQATATRTDRAFADIDGDGILDVVSVGEAPFLDLQRGIGGRKYEPWQTLSFDGRAGGLTIDDFDGDGLLDVGASRRELGGFGGAVVVFRGQGSAGFLPGQSLAVGPDPGDITSGDVNGDGLPDLVTTRLNTTLVSVVLMGPGGVPQNNRQIPCSSGRAMPELADLDGDGDLDLVLGYFASSPGMELLTGDGAGGFSAPVALVPFTQTSYELIDADRDGDLDLCAMALNLAFGRAVWLNNGAGSFTEGAPLPSGTVVAQGDYDGDGIVDMVALRSADEVLTFLRGDGVGGFQPTGAEADVNLGVLDSADADGDGSEDLLVAFFGTSSWGVIDAPDSNGFASFLPTFPATGPGAMTSGDFDGDGQVDLAWETPIGLRIGYGAGDRAWPPVRIEDVPTLLPQALDSLETADLDGDGDLDFVVWSGFAIGAIENTASGFTSHPVITYGFMDDVTAFRLADATGDGLADLLVGVQPSFGTAYVNVFASQGDLTFATPTLTLLASISAVRALDAGDIDGDGLWDLVVSTTQMVAFLGSAPTVPVPLGQASSDVRVSDLNGDGIDEIVAGSIIGTRLVKVMGLDSTSGAFATLDTFEASRRFAKMRLADVDGDGIPDIVGGSGGPFAASPYVLVIGLSSAGTAEGEDRWLTGPAATEALTLDFDGDGIVDLVTRSSEGLSVGWGSCLR